MEEDDEDLPDSTESFQDEDDSVRAREKMFVGKFVIGDNVDGVEVVGISPVTRKDAGREGALQRCETKDGVGIPAEDELVEAVAESADAVVENDRVRHGLGGMDDSNICGIKIPALSIQRTKDAVP